MEWNPWPKGLEPISLSQKTENNKEPAAFQGTSKPTLRMMTLLLVSGPNPVPICFFGMHTGHVPSLR